ncbi:MAG: SEL1-like repeat protein [Akkermansiaceae bacterium]|nr:SEL1-like repeat protein [Akkermansiaceae bacterium]
MPRLNTILGECYYFGDGVEQNKKEAARWYQKAAEQSHAKAREALRELGVK